MEITIITELLQRIGWGWLTVAIVMLWVLGRTGIVQRWFDWRVDKETNISTDIRNLIDSLSEQLENEQKSRRLDGDYYRNEIDKIRQENTTLWAQHNILVEANGKLSEAVSNAERGNSRLRHAIGDALAEVHSMQFLMRRNGMMPPLFPFNSFLGLDRALDDKIRQIFSNIPTIDVRSEQPGEPGKIGGPEEELK